MPVVEVPLESVSLDLVASQVRLASRCFHQVDDEEILFSLLVALQVELVELVHRENRQVAVPADVHQASLVVEAPWVPVSLWTCFLLFHHQEEEDRLEAVLLASLHQEVAYPNLVVPGPEEVVSAGWDHCTPEWHHCLRLARWKLEMAHPADSSPTVPRTNIWSTE